MSEGSNYKPLPMGNPGSMMGGRGPQYPDEMTAPMRAELTSLGVKELLSAEDVAAELDGFTGTAVVIINSVCGCAAGGARPGLAIALGGDGPKPDKTLTAFAGVHRDAVDAVRARVPAPPSSPSIIMFKGGQPMAMMHRADIEVRAGHEVGEALSNMFGEFCGDSPAE